MCVCYRILCQFSSSNFYPYIRGLLLLHTSPHVMGALNNTHMVPAPFSMYKCGMDWIHTRTFSALSCLYKKDLSIFTCFHCCFMRNISSIQAMEKQYFFTFFDWVDFPQQICQFCMMIRNPDLEVSSLYASWHVENHGSTANALKLPLQSYTAVSPWQHSMKHLLYRGPLCAVYCKAR